MGPEIVIAMYRPEEGKDEELRELIAKHLPALRSEGLITDRPAILARSRNGTYLEVFEWRSADGSRQAHESPAVAEIWGAMGKIASFAVLESLDEAGDRFPHFEPIDLS